MQLIMRQQIYRTASINKTGDGNLQKQWNSHSFIIRWLVKDQE